jgi:hypothetical protein
VIGLPSFWAPGSFHAYPTTVAIGQTVTFSGAGCPAGASAQVVAPAARNPVITGSDRTWSVNAVVPDDSRIGAVPAFATCETRPNTATAYTPITLNVTTFRHLNAQPSTRVRTGTTLTITAIGDCPYSPSNSVDVALYDAHHQAEGDTRTQLIVASDGKWSGPFTVPTSLAAGSYFLVANCEGFRSFGAGYTPLPISVLGAGHREIPATR